MSKVAVYARYSTDLQNQTSIEGQFRLCDERAEREGWVIYEHYSDRGISGAGLVNRPGIGKLLEDARAGKFDTVVVEHLDRLSRSRKDSADIFDRLTFFGVQIVSLADGIVNSVISGVRGLPGELELENTPKKTWRGFREMVEDGKFAGGYCYGYDVVKRFNAEGKPVSGERKINEAEAAVVRRIFKMFGDGMSPRAIARRLNAEGVPGPTGRPWMGGTIRGHVKRGTGILNNELYIGRLVWNRLRYIKDPDTGKRVSRLNPEAEWIIHEAPEFQIIDDDLWQRVVARKAEISARYEEAGASGGNGLTAARRPPSLLSGLLSCGVCGGSITIVGKDRYGCATRKNLGTCSNSRTVLRPVIESRVLGGLRDHLLAPEIAAQAVKRIQEDYNRIARERMASRTEDERQLASVRKKIGQIVTTIEDGGSRPALLTRLDELEDQKAALEARLAEPAPSLPAIHPGLAEMYRRKVAHLETALNDPSNRVAARDAIRGLIEKVSITPGDKRGEVNITLYGELAALLEFAGQKNKDRTPKMGVRSSVVAGACNVFCYNLGPASGFAPGNDVEDVHHLAA